MNKPTDTELVTEFIGYHRIALDRENILCRQGAEWAPDFVGELAYDDPARCWLIAKIIAQEKPGEEAMMVLGGTLSTLLREHPEIIDTVATDTKANGSLRELLSWVMEDENIPSKVWHVIEQLSESNS